MSILSPESSFSLSKGPIFRLLLLPSLLLLNRGMPLAEGTMKSGSERDYLHRNHRVLVFPPPQSFYLYWSLSLFPPCSTEFTVKTQEAEWFPLRKVPEGEVKEQSHHQALWAIPAPALRGGFRRCCLGTRCLEGVFCQVRHAGTGELFFSPLAIPEKGALNLWVTAAVGDLWITADIYLFIGDCCTLCTRNHLTTVTLPTVVWRPLSASRECEMALGRDKEGT